MAKGDNTISSEHLRKTYGQVESERTWYKVRTEDIRRLGLCVKEWVFIVTA